MKPVVLHIGAPKTGTSFLQQWLSQNAHGLRSYYSPGIGPSHRIAVEFITDPARRAKDDVVGISRYSLDEALAPLGDDRSVIFSSEYFFTANPARVVDFFAAHGFAVQSVVCFLRRQDKWLAAGHAQSVKASGVTSVSRSLRYAPVMDWYGKYFAWSEVLPAGGLRMVDYDAVAKNLLPTFKKLLDIDYSTNDVLPRVNESLDAEMTEIARMLNVRGIPFSAERLASLQVGSGPRFGFGLGEVETLESAYLPSNAALAARLPHLAGMAKGGWEPNGIDLSGKVSEERMDEIISALRAAA